MLANTRKRKLIWRESRTLEIVKERNTVSYRQGKQNDENESNQMAEQLETL
jgi:hypothetical protein